MTTPMPSAPVQTNRRGQHRRSEAEVRPDFFIVGAPKCGTTAMAEYLAAHPDIFMARKEMHFFGRDLRFAPHFYRRAEREYLAEFKGWDGQSRIGEASVWYLFSEAAAAEIKAFNPAARIIVMLREPVEMMYSLFQYFRYDGNEPLATFEAALAAEAQRRAGRGAGRQTYFAPGLVYRETARFARQVARYFDVFGRSQVRVVFYEDMVADPSAVYRDTLEFLEVDSTFSLPQFDRINAGKSVKSRALRAVLNDPATRAAVLAVRPWVPQAVFHALHRVERALDRANSSVTPAPALAPELKGRLRHEFAAEVGQLSDLIGRDLTHWTRDHRQEQKP